MTASAPFSCFFPPSREKEAPSCPHTMKINLRWLPQIDTEKKLGITRGHNTSHTCTQQKKKSYKHARINTQRGEERAADRIKKASPHVGTHFLYKVTSLESEPL